MPETPDRHPRPDSRLDHAIEAIINDAQLRRLIAIDPESACAALGLSLAERTLLLTWLQNPR